MSVLVALAASHSAGFIALAFSVCALMAVLVIGFTERARALSGSRRLVWMGAVAAIAGFGVWATHFVAMIGYRPDVVLSFALGPTLLSAGVSILFAGVPLALAALMRRRAAMMACGAAAGLGIGAMHYLGMAALNGCVATHGVPTVLLSLLFGSVFGSLAFATRPIGWRFPGSAAMLVLAVCLLHFTAVAGVELRFLPGTHADSPALEPDIIAIAVAAVAVMLIVVALLSAAQQHRLDTRDAQQARLLAVQADLLANALHNMSNGLVMFGPDLRIVLHNERARRLLHMEPGDIADGMGLDVFLANVGVRNGWDAAKVGRAVANHLSWIAVGEPVRLEQTFDSGDVVSVSCSPIGGGAVITFDDVTREHQTQSRMAYMAHHDALTGLPNRHAFQEQLEAAVAAERGFSLLVIDLDRFKEINDTLGHAAGDAVLVRTAGRLRQACGPRDFVARLGGDELAVIHAQSAEASDEALAARIIESIVQPGPILGEAHSITCSVGIATAADMVAAAGRESRAEVVMRQADLALYRSKEAGRARFARFHPDMMELAARRHRMERDLGRAIAAGEFALAFQPLFDVGTMAIDGFEALIRWNHPERGPVSPAEFVPEAERTGQIVAIGEFVLREACRAAAAWPEPIRVAINVSPVQLRSPGFALQVASALAANGLSPARLEIELTETALVEDARQIAACLSALRTLGVGVSMDDFGTGYSSLAHLRNFELDRIKIDRSFVDAAPGDPGCLAVLRAVTQLGRELGVKTLGEGVETPEQLGILRELGCDGAQGFLLGRPMRGEAVAGFIEENAAARDAAAASAA